MPQEEPSFQEILQFDPFDSGAGGDPPADTPEPAEGGTPPPDTPGDEPTEGQIEAQTPSETPPAPAVPPKPQVVQADLEAAIRQIPSAIMEGFQRSQPQQPAAPSQTQPRFQLAVPDALVNALRSEDPKEFSAGVGAMINGVANHVWNTFQDTLAKEIMPNIPRMIENYVNTVQRQESVARDFYGKYPQLNIPELKPVVQSVGAMLAQEYAQQGRALDWGDALRDAIAERIFQRLPMLRTIPQQQAPAQPQRRAFSTGNGARPPAAPLENSLDDMTQVLFGGTR